MAETQAEPLAVDNDALDNGAESDLEDGLLAEFYAFTYEDAVLVGSSGSPPKLSGKDSPLKRPPSPTRKAGSPPKQVDQQQPGPTASHVAGASAAGEPPLLSREIIDAMLPPKTWRDERGKWQRVVRLAPSTRAEVVRLEEVFTQMLEENQARGSAICPVREKFFLQVFEELIRQCACECPERGLLLLRIRDELRLTMEGYQTLYHSSIAYGRQKAVQAEAGIVDLEERVQHLLAEQERLREEKRQLTHRLLLVESLVAEDEQKQHQQHRGLVQFLRSQHAQLETFHNELTQETTWK